jgi:poly-gamma-glutamate synthesis protein (capsule biosynthesis protein)
VLQLTLHPGAALSARFLPAVVSATGQPVLLTGSARSAAERDYAALRGCAGLTATPQGR